MQYELALINIRKTWWLLLLVAMLGVLGGLGLPELDAYSPWASATAGVGLLVGSGWLFWCIEKALLESVSLTVLANRLVLVNHCTGTTRTWVFSEVVAYRLLPVVRGITTLRLTLATDCRLSTRDTGWIGSPNADQLQAVANAFGQAWLRQRQPG